MVGLSEAAIHIETRRSLHSLQAMRSRGSTGVHGLPGAEGWRMKTIEISEREWDREFRRVGRWWVEFAEPLKLVRAGKLVKIAANGQAVRIQKCFYNYAQRDGVRVTTHVSKDRKWVYARTKDDGWRNYAKELESNSVGSQKGAYSSEARESSVSRGDGAARQPRAASL